MLKIVSQLLFNWFCCVVDVCQGLLREAAKEVDTIVHQMGLRVDVPVRGIENERTHRLGNLCCADVSDSCGRRNRC